MSEGLTKFGARYYDPNTGRWTQIDPVGGSIANPATMNGYIYGGDSPTNNVDPSGKDFLGIAGALADIGDAISNGLSDTHALLGNLLLRLVPMLAPKHFPPEDLQPWLEALSLIAAGGELGPDQPIRYHHLAGSVRGVLVSRTFELWHMEMTSGRR